jgi:predicted ribosome quality control (RQC) complex YloA/Tae2 family protein
MALDGVLLSCLKRELQLNLENTRIDKVFQPSREELVIAFRGREKALKLYLSARVQSPRVHFTGIKLENPPTPPMFCMLLRKRLVGGKFVDVRQPGAERVLYLDFDCVNELGDLVRLTLAVEMLGKHSNILLIDQNGKVVDAIKRVDLSMSEIRPLLPGVQYEAPPPLPDRLDMMTAPVEEIVTRATLTDRPLSDALLGCTLGLSPLLCREIALRVTGQVDGSALLDTAQKENLVSLLSRLQQIGLGLEPPTPYLVYREDGTPLEYSIIPILQYGAQKAEQKSSISQLLDTFYGQKDGKERLKQQSADIRRVLSTLTDRIRRKLDHQQGELASCAKRDRYRVYADLINANLHLIEKGVQKVTLINYYDPDCKETEVPLDETLSAAANAQKYYKMYRKAKTAETVLAEQIKKGEAELSYLQTVSDALSRAETVAETDALREELQMGGYLRRVKTVKKSPTVLGPKTFVSDDGFTILVGRNNVGNDRLTTKTAQKYDIWMHVKNIPGSHVVVVTEGKTPPDRTLEQAAILAALYSKAADSKQVPVDYTEVKHVHKPAGAKPGFVIYDHNRTAYVDPDPLLAEKLKSE